MTKEELARQITDIANAMCTYPRSQYMHTADIESLCRRVHNDAAEQAADIADQHASCEGIAEAIAAEIRKMVMRGA